MTHSPRPPDPPRPPLPPREPSELAGWLRAAGRWAGHRAEGGRHPSYDLQTYVQWVSMPISSSPLSPMALEPLTLPREPKGGGQQEGTSLGSYDPPPKSRNAPAHGWREGMHGAGRHPQSRHGGSWRGKPGLSPPSQRPLHPGTTNAHVHSRDGVVGRLPGSRLGEEEALAQGAGSTQPLPGRGWPPFHPPSRRLLPSPAHQVHTHPSIRPSSTHPFKHKCIHPSLH